MNSHKRTIVCIGTGPSLRPEQIAVARAKGFTLYGVNLVYQIVPDLAVLFATNAEFWDFYWHRADGPSEYPCEKWTNNDQSAFRYHLHYIASRDAPGLSRDPHMIHHGHSSGACLVNLAALHGAERIVLLGYDMKYAPNYDGRERKIGISPRHYFGEYPSALQHWPKVNVVKGVHGGLIEHYETVAAQNSVSILNATPDSALTCFPQVPIEEL